VLPKFNKDQLSLTSQRALHHGERAANK